MPKVKFQSTSPVWRTTSVALSSHEYKPFQSTSPVWRTTRAVVHILAKIGISIHVPRVEDDKIKITKAVSQNISIHVPRVEDDL